MPQIKSMGTQLKKIGQIHMNSIQTEENHENNKWNGDIKMEIAMFTISKIQIGLPIHCSLESAKRWVKRNGRKS